jgi:SAM-dependent methyltransferase
MIANCPICTRGPCVEVTNQLRRGSGIVYYCASCDMAFLIPDKPKSDDYYSGEYRRHVSHRAKDSSTTPAEVFDAYRGYQSERLGFVRPALAPGCDVLEIGAGAGQFIHHLRDSDCRLHAIEPDPDCCEHMRGMDIDADSRFLRFSRFREQKFDVVCAFQVMEHSNDAVLFMREIKAVLKPGGRAFIEVPNLYEPLMSAWDIPEYRTFFFHDDHLFYFSYKALHIVASYAGFQQFRVRFTQDYNVLSHLHWLMNRGPQPTCHIGLGPSCFPGQHGAVANWLNSRLTELDRDYRALLKSECKTSNLMLIATND